MSKRTMLSIPLTDERDSDILAFLEMIPKRDRARELRRRIRSTLPLTTQSFVVAKPPTVDNTLPRSTPQLPISETGGEPDELSYVDIE